MHLRKLHVSLLLLPLLAACGDPREWRRDRIEVTGELRADGTCVVRVDGRPVFADTVRMRHHFSRAHEFGGPYEGWDRWRLRCAPEGSIAGIAVAGVQVPGAPVRPGTYTVEAFTRKARAHVVNAMLYDPPPRGEKKPVAYLEGFEGTVTVLSLDTAQAGAGPRAAATFRFVGRRVGPPPF